MGFVGATVGNQRGRHREKEGEENNSTGKVGVLSGGGLSGKLMGKSDPRLKQKELGSRWGGVWVPKIRSSPEGREIFCGVKKQSRGTSRFNLKGSRIYIRHMGPLRGITVQTRKKLLTTGKVPSSLNVEF